jgi:hypothetical protein
MSKESIAKQVLILLIAFGLVCGQTNAQESASDKSKLEIRNNAASLLADLLGQDKNVSKILIIKRNPDELRNLMKAISKAAGNGTDDLEALAKGDKSLNLHALQLPPGEVAARAAISKTDEHELLTTPGGEKFELRLLLTQTEALKYGSHLAKVAAENSSLPEQQRKFRAIDVSLNNLYEQVVAKLRALPGK